MRGLEPSSTARSLGAAWRSAVRRRSLFATGDRDQAREAVGRVFRPHRLEPAGAAASLDARMDYLPMGGVFSLSSLSYGAEVEILPGPLERFYLIQIPVAGRAVIDAGGERFESSPACAALLSPSPDLAMRWGEGNEQLILRFDAEPLRRFAASWCGDARLVAPTFAPQLSLDAIPSLAPLLLSMLALASHCADPGDAPQGALAAQRYPLSVVQLHYRLMALLLAHQRHSAAERLDHTSPPLAPRHVRQVEDLLTAHPERPFTPEELAEHAGVSARSLFLGFRRYRGVSPMRLLKEVRLQRVHEELLLGGSGLQITEVALRWGFCHLGRFAQEYRAMYGETPRQTLER